MAKPRRKSITEMMSDTSVPEPAPEPTPSPVFKPTIKPKLKTGTKARTRQQTLYLNPDVYEQLRTLGFQEHTKMHTLVLEGLDRVFKNRGLQSINELSKNK